MFRVHQMLLCLSDKERVDCDIIPDDDYVIMRMIETRVVSRIIPTSGHFESAGQRPPMLWVLSFMSSYDSC